MSLAASPAEANQASTMRPSMSGITLDTLLHSNLEARSTAALLRPADGEPLSYAELDRRVSALAGLCASVEPPAGAQVVIAAPLGPEAVIALMAALRAGLAPHMIPVSATSDEAEAVMTSREAPIAIGISELAELRPLLALRSAAARSYHLRLLAGFGAHLPDGVAPADSLGDAGFAGSTTRCALSVSQPGAMNIPVECTEADIMALALDIAREVRPVPASRIVSTMSGVDATTLASSIGFGLIAGIEVTTLGLFHLARLWGCLTSSMAVHLVAPASIEPALHEAGISRHASLASLILIHEAGLAPPAAALSTGEAHAAIVDIWRGGNGQYAAQRRIMI
ncbi:MAG: AMP-binding protein [Bosea sp. (in: a-proteobacteria)]